MKLKLLIILYNCLIHKITVELAVYLNLTCRKPYYQNNTVVLNTRSSDDNCIFAVQLCIYWKSIYNFPGSHKYYWQCNFSLKFNQFLQSFINNSQESKLQFLKASQSYSSVMIGFFPQIDSSKKYRNPIQYIEGNWAKKIRISFAF